MRISDWSSDVCSSDLSVISASTGRPGPSVLDLGFQVLVSPTACVAEPLELPEPPAASQKSIDRAMEIITSAQNPVLFRSEERRVGTECGGTFRSWWSQYT